MFLLQISDLSGSNHPADWPNQGQFLASDNYFLISRRHPKEMTWDHEASLIRHCLPVIAYALAAGLKSFAPSFPG
jgi:hypothetical protein